MNEDAKKNLLRLIPHALYVLACRVSGKTAVSTVSWVTQASFKPPLVVVGLKKDSLTFETVKEARSFTLNFLGKDQKDVAQKFFKRAEPEGHSIAGEDFLESPLYQHPIFPKMTGFLECKVLEIVDLGDHSVVVAEVREAQSGPLEGPLLLSTTGWQYGG